MCFTSFQSRVPVTQARSDLYEKIILVTRSELAAVIIWPNLGLPKLVDHAQSRYIVETREDIAL